MILLRSVFGKWHMAMPRYSLSTLKGVKQTKVSQLPNPFKNKSYEQINRIMSLNISRKNEIIFCSLVLSAALDRMEIEFSKKEELSTTQKNSKQGLMNKVLEKMFVKLEQLTPQDACLIVKMILTAYENRYFKLTNRNKEIFQNDLQNHLSIQIEADKTGLHKNTFKEILYTMLKSKKRINLLKQIIQYLTIHDLKTNQEMLIFFNQFSSHVRTGYYNQSIEPVLNNFMAMNTKNLDRASEWVQPVVLEVILIYTDKLRIESNPYFKQFLVGLQHQFKNSKISIENEVLFFKYLLEWAQWSSPYFLKIEEITQGVNLIYAMMKDLMKRIEEGEEEQSFNGFIYLIVMIDRFREFSKFAHRVIRLNQKDLINQFDRLIQLIFSRKFIPKFHQLESQQMVQIITCQVPLSENLSKQFAERLIHFLHEHEDENYLITRLRIYEFLAKLIIQKKVKVDLTLLAPLIKKIESKSHKLKDYEIIRIRNVLKLLKMESVLIENLFRQLFNKKQAVIIENMARTTLKEYSIGEIQKYSQILIERREIQRKNRGISGWADSSIQSSIRNSLWSSFKKVRPEGSEQNIDPIFLFWVDKNARFFNEITKDYRNCYLILSNAVKQFNLGAKGIQGSINYQILFQILKSWSNQNPNPKPEEYTHLIADNLRSFAQSDHISSLFQKDFRHSFFIKVMWAFQILKETPTMKESYIKRFRQITQIMLLAKSFKLNLYREKPTIKGKIIQNYLNSLQISQSLRLKLYSHILESWFWTSYHRIAGVRENINFMNMEKIEKLILAKLGPIHLAEFLVGENPQLDLWPRLAQLVKGHVLMGEIYEGKLSLETEINEQTLLNSAVFGNLLQFLFQRHPSCCQVYLQKLVTLKNPIIYQQIVNIANLVERVRMNLRPQAIRKIKQRIKQMLLEVNPKDNPSVMPFYVKFNISSPDSVALIDSYILSELKTGNFYIAQLLFMNGYDNSQAVEFLMNITSKNRVLQFLDFFQKERVILVNGLLGLSLNQSQKSVLKQCINIFVDQTSTKLLYQSRIEQGQIILEYYLLLRVAEARLQQSQSNELNIVMETIKQLKKKNPDIDKELLRSIAIKTNQMIPKNILDSLQVHPQTSMPMWDNKLVIVDRQKPGYTKLVAEYFGKKLGISQTFIVSMDQIDLQLVKQGN